ncbi:DUF3883 domain-containing protein [Oceanimonas baumannii]|uniref:DUF3883 domain-containing protein n=1 Tax=Oceanimonas baumannii TaxID=129578 RepID=UPI003A95CD02
MSRGWSRAEVEETVSDYLDMLFLELSGKKYNKSEYRRNLRAKLNNRTDSAIELKHQNISAVLVGMGIPYINGYKPRGNYQREHLPDVVFSFVAERFGLHEKLESDSKAVPSEVPSFNINKVLEDAPQLTNNPSELVMETKAGYRPKNINYLEREARNQAMGDLGEKFVLDYERQRLEVLGMGSLVGGIEHVADTKGPSAGYDIRSYNSDGTDRFIEVKATKYGKNIPFFVTPNELRFSRDNSDRYYLYRVFDLKVKPRMFHLTGNLENICKLKPTEFMAMVG